MYLVVDFTLGCPGDSSLSGYDRSWYINKLEVKMMKQWIITKTKVYVRLYGDGQNKNVVNKYKYRINIVLSKSVYSRYPWGRMCDKWFQAVEFVIYFYKTDLSLLNN